MERYAKKIGCLFLVCFLVFSKNLYVKAEALPDVLSGSTTLADNIMTYYALSGSAMANQQWISDLYTAYGTNFGTIESFAEQGYLVMNDQGAWEPVQQLVQMIEESPAYASLHLNEMFNVSAEEAAQGGGFAAASGGSILAGSLGGVASTGVVPLLGGVTAAYWGGIALGTLIAHGLGLYEKPVYYGLDVLADSRIYDLVPNGGGIFNRRKWGAENPSYEFYIVDAGVICIAQAGVYNENDGQTYGLKYYNPTNQQLHRYRYNPTTGQIDNTKNLNAKAMTSESTSYYGYTDGYAIYSDPPSGKSWQDLYDSGDLKNKEKYSPDLIGENGNLTGEKNGSEYTIPDMKPQIDPGVQAGKPLTLQDWQNFANSVSNNNNQTNPTELNKSLFDNILDALKVPNPNANPNPNPNPDPYNPPVVNPVPDPTYPDPVPDQPTSENPNESENPQETEPLNPVDTGRPWMLPDLKNKFPFCIPWDIKDCFTLLKSNVRQAPHISWRFNPPHTPIDYTFNLDLTDFEPVATLLRTLELIAFIVGLAFVTRYIIGAS